MATNHIPRNAVLLAAYMERIDLGNDMHKSERPINFQVVMRARAARKHLVDSYTRVKDAEAALAKARQTLREDRENAIEWTRRLRDGVYGTWGKRNSTIKDYGLRPHRSGRPRKST